MPKKYRNDVLLTLSAFLTKLSYLLLLKGELILCASRFKNISKILNECDWILLIINHRSLMGPLKLHSFEQNVLNNIFNEFLKSLTYI